MKKFYLLTLMLVSLCFAKAQTPGNFDPSFAQFGYTTIEFNNTETLSINPSVELQSDGKILTVSNVWTDSRKFVLMRHNTDGTLDTSYGVDGISYFSPLGNTGVYQAFDAKMLDNDYVLVLGYYYNNFGRPILMRFDPNGNIDTSFGDNGWVVYNDGHSVVMEDMAIQADGKILLAGYRADDDLNDEFCIMRFTADGQLDTTFGTNGMFLHAMYNSFGFKSGSYLQSISVAPNGKIYAGGFRTKDDPYWGSVQACILLCLDETGAFDTTFGEDGVLQFKVGEVLDYLIDFAILPDGKIVACGHSETYVEQGGPNYSIFVTRLNADGSFDTAFGADGLTKVQYVKDEGNYSKSIQIADDGQIFVTGNYFSDLQNLLVANFTPDGQLNEEFGEFGFAAIVFGGDICSRGTDAAIDSDGRLVVVGIYEHENTYSDFLIARLFTTLYNDVEENVETGLSIYPNPVAEELNIVNLTENGVATIYDMSGRAVMTTEIHAGGKLNVAQLPTGNYLLKVVCGDKVMKAKFMK